MNGVSGCFCLCGGTFAGTNRTCFSEQRAAAACASARCPRWIGSKLPPKRPIFITVILALYLYSLRCPLVSSFAGSVARHVARLCSLHAFLYQRVLPKTSYEIRLGSRLSLLFT